jgi:acyl carrier protein
MDTNALFATARDVIADVLKIPPDRVTLDANFMEDLNVDSLYMHEVAMALEDAVPIEVPSEDIFNLRTVGDLVKYLAQRLGK